MYDIQCKWKSFNIHLPSFHSWMKSNSQDYIGCSAGEFLILHFLKEPSQQVKDRIQMHFDSMTKEEEEKNKEIDDKRSQAYKAALEVLPTYAWDAMIPAERKIVMNQSLTKSDLDELVKKHIK